MPDEEYGDAEYGYCINCSRDLIPIIDEDPNGDLGCKCAQCLAEESHDFGRYPDVTFGRDGMRIDPDPSEGVDRDKLAESLKISFASGIKQSDEWIPLANHVFDLMKQVQAGKIRVVVNDDRECIEESK